MNHLNTASLKDTIISTFQEILAEDPNFFLTSQLKILTWKSKKIEGALITKIGNLRYLGLLRKDCQGQEYWKYKPLTSNSEPSGEESPAIPPGNSLNQSETDNIAKFQQRQSKIQSINHGESNKSEQSVNSQSS